MRMQWVPLLALLLVSPVISGVINFNTSWSEECSVVNGGCAFDNQSIWENNVVPGRNDTAVIVGSPGTQSLLQIFLREVIYLNSLVAQNAVIQAHFSLILTNLTFNSNSTLEIDNKAGVDVGNTFLLAEAATLSLSSGTLTIGFGTILGAVFTSPGTYFLGFFVTNYAPTNQANTDFQGNATFYGPLNVLTGVNTGFAYLIAQTLTIAPNSSVLVTNFIGTGYLRKGKGKEQN